MQVAFAAGMGKAGRGSARWRSFAWLLLFCFTLQSYITQTHIHFLGDADAGPAIVKVAGKTPFPSDRDPATCPFCQAIATAGAFFTPAAPVLFLPTQWVEAAAPRPLPSIVRRAFARGWHSRAPPQH